MKKALIVLALVVVAVVAALAAGFWLDHRKPEPGTVLDEAAAADRAPESLRGADEDYFRDMDYGATHDPEAVRAALDPYVPGISAADAVQAVARGRNNWIVWSGGNDRFWDEISRRSVNALDFVKTISSHPSLRYGRHNRWEYLGLVNEPCFEEAKGPNKDRFDLWLDHRKPEPGTVLDEAAAAGRAPDTLAGAGEDYFHDMDYGATHDSEAVRAALAPYVPGISAAAAVQAVAKGRNNWIVWSGGNDRFWDEISRRSLNALDFVKTISSHPSLRYGRH
ncbi:MAG TPA: hypothetical protein VGC93_16780, partial [Thermoanaerobaculia bacterium]